MKKMKGLLAEGSNKLNINLSDNMTDALVKYYDILKERNKSVNLTRITEPFDVVTKHFLDSLSPLLTGCVKGKVIDVGTGAGFPGLVLKCANPELEMTLLDSLNKRVEFLKDAASEMDIKENITFLHSRAEDAAHTKEHREKYDTVVSRAVANMRTLSEWCLPFLKPGGYFLALKGPLANSELDDAMPAIIALGGEVADIFSVDIPFTELNHKIIIVKKTRHTPTHLPRKASKSTQIPVENTLNK